MKLIEDFPNFYFPGFYIEQVDDAQGAAVTLTAIWQPHVPVPYIDADGNEQMCTIYNVLTNANGDVAYGELGAENWYVVTNDVTISGRLFFGDYHAHLIVCDGATLNVTNENDNAIAAYAAQNDIFFHDFRIYRFKIKRLLLQMFLQFHEAGAVRNDD